MKKKRFSERLAPRCSLILMRAIMVLLARMVSAEEQSVWKNVSIKGITQTNVVKQGDSDFLFRDGKALG